MARKKIGADELKAKLRAAAPAERAPAAALSTGSTLLNLAAAGSPDAGVALGQYVLVVGDSSSGKTWLGRSILAEASVNPLFGGHRLIHDDAENGAWMDVERFFGRRLAERLEPPAGTPDDPRHSSTVEEFYDRLDDLYRSKTPFVYVLDSENALSSVKDDEQYEKEKSARAADKDASGDYGTHKAKVHSNYLRLVANVKLRETGSVLVILSQTRQRIGFAAQFNPRTRSGGTALKFYAHLELWTSVKEDLKKRVSGKDRQVGIRAKIKVEKSRLTGREGAVEVPIHWSFGIDDVGGMIDYLLEEGHWQEKSGKIDAPEFEYQGKAEGLAALVQEDSREPELKKIVHGKWSQIEAGCRLQRKRRYE
jgi:RecA/RadA recombinase